ncbi:MAG: molybdopterin-dependent oxidoreductase [Phototrophicaceae bacterium]
MNTTNQHPNPLWGLLVGVLFMPLLIALFFLGERFAGLPFLPLNFFDWIARSLPGDLLTFGIDTMVDTLIAIGYGNDLDTVAKTAEQLMGLGIFLGLGAVVTAIFYLIMNQIDFKEISYIPGITFGIAFGLPIMLLALPLSFSSAAAYEIKMIWSLLVFIGFGAAVGWSYNELAFPALAIKAKSGDVEAQGIDRRQFIIRAGGASATLTVIGAGLGALLGGDNSPTPPVANNEASSVASNEPSSPLPNADATLEPAPGTRSELTAVADHYRIDILSGGLPSIPENYALPITGLVANEVNWSLDEIMDLPSQEEYITMSCISNRIAGSLISTTKWTGVSFKEILERVEPQDGAMALRIVGYDDFDEYVDLDLVRNDDRIMLAYHFNDQALPLRNGFPLRIHIPNRYGMKQPKWIRSIEFISEWEPGYWVRRGWSEQAIVNQTSVIDTVASNNVFTDDSGQMRVPIGGIAWAADRDIVAVEVRVDGGDWQVAEMREPLSDRAWTLWRYDWAFEEGDHTFEVRSFEEAPEGQSEPLQQIATSRGTRPDGATGIHSARETFTATQTEASS